MSDRVRSNLTWGQGGQKGEEQDECCDIFAAILHLLRQIYLFMHGYRRWGQQREKQDRCCFMSTLSRSTCSSHVCLLMPWVISYH